MDNEAPALSIARLRSAWDAEVGPSTRRALVAAAFAGLFGAAHLARLGSPLARGLAGAGLALLIVAIAVRAIVARRRRGDARRTVREIIGRTDAALGAATLRALALLDRAAADDRVGSPELAGLHLRRLLGRASHARVVARAQQAAARWATAGLALGALSLAAVALEPSRVVEGLDVLAARGGEAPLDLPWLEDIEMMATPPEYLHQGAEVLLPFATTMQPRGTVITVRGRPIRDGRALVLTDGGAEVPFVDDGKGGVIARWTLGGSTTLQAAARFGQVRVRQADTQRVVSIPDDAPRVILEGAPRTVKLLEEPSIPLRYTVTDDHGLREVDLVLRAGAKEERRVLSRPAADAKVDRGGYELRARDPFFRRTYVPIEVRIEARDNDPIEGPKWGRSEAIVVVPPQVGEPEARRYVALVKVRDALTDLLADRIGQKAPDARGAAAHAAHEAEAQAAARAEVERALDADYGGLRVRGRIASLARGQLARLDEALAAERRSTTRAAHQELLDETEGALLAFDAGLRGLGFRDAQAVAQRLADVADEAAQAAELLGGGDRAAGEGRLDAAVAVLGGGGVELRKLGELGLDLGEIVANDLRRIARARGASDWHHAELAARDLAARLRRPDPSFGGGRGGVESGAPRGPEPGDASSADQEVAQGERDLEELARDHAAETSAVAEELSRARTPEDVAALREEAKRHAEAIREAVRDLPQPGAPPGSAESAAAAGREQAEAMAGALEQGRPEEAVQSGEGAVRSLGEAARLGAQGHGFFPEERAGREAAEAQRELAEELAWAEEALRKLRQAASERAREGLERSSQREGSLADRARDLRKRGERGDSRMPEEVLERLDEAEQAMREAQRALAQGDGEQGNERQRDAQRLLEMSRSDDQSQDSDAEPEGGERDMAKKADIPDKDKHKGPEEFRRRVLEGLGGASEPRLREAVKRYAEGLLK
ncbi:hypothetical protein SOCE26_104990 [Sorangium cellulosum]|uniref:DUF4175 domain-containing protein n=1 Tax=Sorangium cellulosum TaxID=56 RepID=A0A2L0FBM1_SORCE|nr:hypothetical protein SOCE26_104990 [Sorangium cellulosum]